MRSLPIRSVICALFVCLPVWVSAAVAPVIQGFTATPQTPVPGQVVKLSIEARDPDCAAPPCTTACGTYIRGDLVTWTDDTGRTGMFANPVYAANSSPWNGTIEWTAPPADGTYKVTVSIPDNGGMLCGGRKTTVASLDIVVTNARPPVIDSLTVMPSIVRIGGTARVSVVARDPMNRPLTYAFTADAGTIQQEGDGPTALWTAPGAAGAVVLRCTVSAGGSTAKSQVTAMVQIGEFETTMSPSPARPLRVAATADGRLAYVDTYNATVGIYDPSRGSSSWTSTAYATPVGVAVALNEIFVADRKTATVGVFNLSGVKARELKLQGVTPNAVALGPNAGELTVSDTSIARVFVISAANGAILRTISDPLMISPAGVAVARGKIAVADPLRSRVFIFDASGTLLATLGDDTLLTRPQGVAWDALDPANTRIVTVDSFTGALTIFSGSGSVLGTLGGYGTGDGQLMSAIDVALVQGGRLAVTTASGNIVKFSLESTLPPLAPPAGVTAVDKPDDNGGALNVAWSISPDDPARVTGYRVERSADATAFWQPVTIVERGSTTYADAQATGGNCFRYRVVAFDGVMEAASADSPCVSPLNELVPDAPASAVASALSSTDIHLSWTPSAAQDLASYAITFAPAGGSPTVINVSAGTVEYLFGGLQKNSAYAFEVRAIDVAGNMSLPAGASARTFDDSAPGAPVLSAADANTSGELDVNWTLTEATAPVTRLTITLQPVTPGWPVVTKEIVADRVETSGRIRISGLVNRLQYQVTAVAMISSTRVSATSSSVAATPTALARALPVLDVTGWEGSGDPAFAAGITVILPAANPDPKPNASAAGRRRATGSPSGASALTAVFSQDREVKLQYRTVGSTIQPLIDGTPYRTSLPDTGGEWRDATITIDKHLFDDGVQHLLELRNTAFPSPAAQAAVRLVDFVPLPLRGLKSEEFNTVVDLVWDWNDYRADLGVRALRSPRGASTVVEVACEHPEQGLCRDTFLENGGNYEYELSAISPAGWVSEPVRTHGGPRYEPVPPPVTDLRVSKGKGADGRTAYVLDWKWLSSEIEPGSGAKPVTGYRVYVLYQGSATLVAETQVAGAKIADTDFYPGTQTVVVRAVDALGRESQ